MVAKTSKRPPARLHLKWVRSAICYTAEATNWYSKAWFTRLNQVIERPDNAAIRACEEIPHL